MSVFTGARQSMAALARALVEDGHRRLAVEDPGSPGLWAAASTAGLELVGLPVDGQGMVVDALARFLESGAYDRHLRSSRLRLRARRNALVAEPARLLPDAPVTGAQSGLHFLLELPPGADPCRVPSG